MTKICANLTRLSIHITIASFDVSSMLWMEPKPMYTSRSKYRKDGAIHI